MRAAFADHGSLEASPTHSPGQSGFRHSVPASSLRDGPAFSLRDYLRAGTAEIHAAIHAAEPFASIARGEMDRPGYLRLLRVLERFHETMAPLCRAGCQVLRLPDVQHAFEARVERLRGDLRHFGATPAGNPGVTGGNTGVRAAVTEVAGDRRPEAFAIGSLYTVLGSALGGRVIDRQLQFLLPQQEGRHFFRGSDNDGAAWRSFCVTLKAYGHDNWEARPVVLAGAQHAFAIFGACLESC